jgi:ferric-dicitrate binding protein FerR (iron transport regulator)
VTTARDVLGELVNAAGRRPEPPREDYEYVLEAAMAAWRHKVRSRRRRRWALAIAASVTVAVMGTTLSRWMPRSPMLAVATPSVLRGNVEMRFPGESSWRALRPGSEIMAGSRLRSGAGAGLALVLKQGVSIRLDSQSELEMQSATVLQLVTGAVYVDSGSALSSGGLRVVTRLGTVADVGTVFEVRTEPGLLRIRVREGRVQVDSASHSVQLRSEAGEALELDEHGVIRRPHVAATDSAWAWAEALATAPDVEGRPLLPFLAWVARETGRRLQFEGPDVEAHAREVILHGETRDLTPLQALDLMLSTTDLEYVLSADEAIVIRRRQD